MPQKVTKKTDLSQKIEILLVDNLDTIKTFDANKDGIIDTEELKFASNVVADWYNATTSDEKNWFYYGSGKPIGPMSWKDIRKANQKYPEMFLSHVEDGKSENIKFWLPSKVLHQLKK